MALPGGHLINQPHRTVIRRLTRYASATASAIDHFQGILNTFRGDLIYSDGTLNSP